MSTPSDRNSIPVILVLSFNRPAAGTQRFYFYEMSTLQATGFLPLDSKIVSCKVIAYTSDSKYLDNQTVDGFTTLKDFNNFFSRNAAYYIYDCEIAMESEIIIQSHDDGEVTIEFPVDDRDSAKPICTLNCCNYCSSAWVPPESFAAFINS